MIPTESPAGTEYFGFIYDRTHEMELEQVRDGVMSAISHELRTPLTAIIGNLDLLSSKQLAEQDIESALGDATSEARKLNLLVQSILNFAKFAGGTAVLNQTTRPVDPVIEMLTQLLLNAQKHGGPEVEVVTRVIGGGAEIQVTDNGTDIPFGDAGRAVEAFVQGGGRQPGQGAGLGLTVCKGIVDAHGGTLSVVNRRGASVTAWFPDATNE